MRWSGLLGELLTDGQRWRMIMYNLWWLNAAKTLCRHSFAKVCGQLQQELHTAASSPVKDPLRSSSSGPPYMRPTPKSKAPPPERFFTGPPPKHAPPPGANNPPKPMCYEDMEREHTCQIGVGQLAEWTFIQLSSDPTKVWYCKWVLEISTQRGIDPFLMRFGWYLQWRGQAGFYPPISDPDEHTTMNEQLPSSSFQGVPQPAQVQVQQPPSAPTMTAIPQQQARPDAEGNPMPLHVPAEANFQ